MNLKDLSALTYQTDQVNVGVGSEQVASASLRLFIDTDGQPGVDDVLVYEPYYQTQAITNSIQTWDADAGKWWSSYQTSYDEIPSGPSAGGYETNFTLQNVLKSYPGATILGLNVGADNNNNATLVVDVDKLTINDTVYDFELVTAQDTQDPTVPQSLGWKSGINMLPCDSVTRNYSVSAIWNASEDNTGVVAYDYRVMTPVRDTWEEAYGQRVFTNQYDGAFTEGEGVYTFQVRAVDAAGNVSEWSDDCAIRYRDSKPMVLGVAECKNGGHTSVYTATDGTFKNQGQCIAYVQSSDNSKHRR